MQAADLVVLWRVFEPCNLGCAFCGYSKEIHRPRAVVDAGRILAFGEILDAYRRAYSRRILVSWLGGEPLLWRELPRLSRVFKRRYRVQLGVTTNGEPLDSPAVRAALIADFDHVVVSVDGVGSIHDRGRGAPGLFERIRKNTVALCAEASAAGSPLVVKVNTILMRDNLAHFEALCREVAGWGVCELTFNQLGGHDRPEFYADHRLLPEQVDRFARELPHVRKRMTPRGLAIHGSERYLQRLASTSRGQSIAIDDCAPGAWFLFIDEQGLVGPCSFTARGYGVPLENIADASTLHALPEVFAQRRRNQRLSPCDDCHSTQVFEKFS